MDFELLHKKMDALAELIKKQKSLQKEFIKRLLENNYQEVHEVCPNCKIFSLQTTGYCDYCFIPEIKVVPSKENYAVANFSR